MSSADPSVIREYRRAVRRIITAKEKLLATLQQATRDLHELQDSFSVFTPNTEASTRDVVPTLSVSLHPNTPHPASLRS